MLRATITAIVLAIFPVAQAAEYNCKVEKKFDADRTYSQTQIEKGQFAVLVDEKGNSAFLSRCSYAASAKKVTCDQYQVDKVIVDEYVKIKKFYVFRSQFDVQIFTDLSFVENNGRGGIAFGKCDLVAP